MKEMSPCFWFFLVSVILAAGAPAQDAPVTTHLKLMVINEAEEMLLVKYQGV